MEEKGHPGYDLKKLDTVTESPTEGEGPSIEGALLQTDFLGASWR